MKKFFTLLAASLLTVGAWADTVKLVPSEISSAATNKTVFKSGYELTNTGDKNTGSGNDDYAKTTKYVKYSSGVLYTIVIPEGRQVTAVSITGGTRKDGTTTYLAELNSVKYTSTDYVFVDGLDKKQVDPTTFDFTLDVPASGTMTFKHQGTESIFNIILTDEEKPTVGASGLAWSDDNISYKVRDALPEAPTFANPNNLPVTFTTSNAEVAEVTADGVVTLHNTKVGTAKVTATFAGNDDFEKEVLVLDVEVKTNEVFVKHQNPGVEPTYFILDKMLPATKDSYEAGEIFADDNLQILAHSKTISTTKYSGSYGGYTFTKGIQVRVEEGPNDESPYGKEYGDDISGTADETTSLVVKPAVDMTLYVYGRRQVLEDTNLRQTEDDEENNVVTVNQYFMFYPDDSKALKFNHVNHDADQIVEKNSYLGKWDGIEYIYGISEVELEANHEYNMFAVGTTYIVNGIGYIVKDKDASVVTNNKHVVHYTKDGNNLTDDFGFTLSRTGTSNILKGNTTDSKNKITIDGADYAAFRMKGLITANLDQVTYSIAAPKDMIISKATIYAFANSGAEESYFTHIGGHNFEKGDLPAISSTDNTNPVVIEVDHVMLNKMDMNVSTVQDKDISVVVAVEYIYAHHTPEAPALKVDGADHNGEEIELSGKNVKLVITPAEGHFAYYHFAEAAAAAQPAAVKAMAEEVEAPATLTVNGKEFTRVPEEGVTLSKAGTLSYLSHNPVNGLKSEVKTLAVSGDGETTGIENITVDSEAAVEYYNLQGIRVANPENGVFIRRQGNDVKKVIL